VTQRRGRRYAVIATLVALTVVAGAMLARLAFGDEEPLVKWDHAVVLFDADGHTATVVVVYNYNAGEGDRARRLEIEQEDEPGTTITIGLRFAPDDDDSGLVGSLVVEPACVKARVRGLRPSPVPGELVLDRDDSEIEGRGAPDAGFTLPPLSQCRTVAAEVVER
jgi:hypothetical protein